MSIPPPQPPTDQCYRCGYDLRGIANDSACPECGLIAERSRRVTDELHDTRPQWLRSLSRGINFILLSIITLAAAPPIIINFVLGPAARDYQFARAMTMGFDVAGLFLLYGVFCLTRREGYAPADQADRRLRRLLRVAILLPILALILAHIYIEVDLAPHTVIIVPHGFLNIPISISRRANVFPPNEVWTVAIILAALSASIPLLLFLRLRGLAKRVRSDELAEHCAIVGVGASATILYAIVVIVLVNKGPSWGLGNYHEVTSNTPLMLMLAMFVAAILFLFWSLFLLVRFAFAFWTAARNLRRKWSRDDRSITSLSDRM